ncbi:MAG: DNA polymerase III subunit alpha, partial [Pseudomonadota bacterium]
IDDTKTFDMLTRGETVGVFQLESQGMRKALVGMRPDRFEDIIALVALYRPGPMDNIPTYNARKHGEEPTDYYHPKIEKVLKETYGVIIYQEQVMQIAQILSGYSLGEADLLRRAMGKKKKEEMDKQRKRFVDGAVERGVEAAKASSIFDLVQKFAGYGFNKSHAAAYAYIAYQTGYLKANHPAALLAASMSLDRANTDKLAVFLKEAKRSDVEVRAPHINVSQTDFSVEKGAILYGLSAVKNVGEAAMAEIVDERGKSGPYTDVFDFAERVNLRAIGKRAMENLARAGAFDGLVRSRAAALQAADMLIKYSASVFEERASDQGGLFDLAGPAGAPGGLERPRMPDCDAWPPLEQLNQERAALGFYFSGHPLDDYEKELIRLKAVTCAEAEARAKDGRIGATIAAVVRAARFRRSKAGKPFAWVECSDAASEFEVTVFSEVLNANRDLFEPGALLLLAVNAEDRDGEVRFTVEGVRPLDMAAAQTTSQLRISVSSESALERVKKRLSAVKPAAR